MLDNFWASLSISVSLKNNQCQPAHIIASAMLPVGNNEAEEKISNQLANVAAVL